MEISQAFEKDTRRCQGMHSELKHKEWQLPVSMFVKGKPKHVAAWNFRDNDAPVLRFVVIKLYWMHFVPCALLYSLCYSFLTAWLPKVLWTTFEHILIHLRMMLLVKDRRTARSKDRRTARSKKGILTIIDFGVHTPFNLTIL